MGCAAYSRARGIRENTVSFSALAIESVRTTWVHFLRELSYCYGSHQGQIYCFPQESHQSKRLLQIASLVYGLFPGNDMSHGLILITEWNQAPHHKETTETHSDLNRSPKQWKKTHNHLSHPLFLQFHVGTCKNNMSPKILGWTESSCVFEEMALFWSA
jgi:hypothetical protein